LDGLAEAHFVTQDAALDFCLLPLEHPSHTSLLVWLEGEIGPK
jgi:hypothetical protein